MLTGCKTEVCVTVRDGLPESGPMKVTVPVRLDPLELTVVLKVPGP
jgi:hypothetical protein